ncbi:unnamed protein product [Boreogadus saida]
MESRSPGGVEGGGGGRDADHRADADDDAADDAADAQPAGTAPTLSMDQIRVVAARSGNEYTDGPTLGAPEPGPPGLPPPARHFSLTPCSSPTTTTAPGGGGSSSPAPPRGGSLPPLQRLGGNDGTIRTQPKRAAPVGGGEERKPLTAVVGGAGGGGPAHSRRCAACGRCACGECARPRALPTCWVCGRRCVCSARGAAEVATCVCLVRGLFYHCSSDDEDTCSEKPFSCTQAHCAARWAAVALLALPLPCIACYPLARGCAAAGQRCYDTAARPGCRCEGGARRRRNGGGGGGGGGKTTTVCCWIPHVYRVKGVGGAGGGRLILLVCSGTRSIAYLFPSGLFEKRSRPLMKHPEEIFPRQRAVQWGEDGRPFHFLFYTGKQSYYSLMHEIYAKIQGLERQQDRLRAKGLLSSSDTKPLSLGSSRWIIKEELEGIVMETVTDHDYQRFLQLMERLAGLPQAGAEGVWVLRFRQQLEAQASRQAVAALQADAQGRAFSTAEGRRKTSNSSVVLRDGGSGRATVNGSELLSYFPVFQDREQVMFPLQFAGVLGRLDVEAEVSGGGRSSQAGAVRLAISRALLGFLSEREVENMRQAGLLTPDPRVRERDKPGQEGARRKFTWKKR